MSGSRFAGKWRIREGTGTIAYQVDFRPQNWTRAPKLILYQDGAPALKDSTALDQSKVKTRASIGVNDDWCSVQHMKRQASLSRRKQ